MDSIEEIGGRSQTVNRTVRVDASREKATGKGVFPPLPSTSPSADRFDRITLSPEAVLYSFTVIHPNPKTGLAPFALVYADFPEDTRVFGRLVLADGAHPVIGSRLRVVAASEGEDANANFHFEVVAGGRK